jgi:hypothetical protein
VRYLSVGVCLLVLCRTAAAQPAVHQSRLRATSPDLQRLIDEASERSETFRALVDEIERSDVIVYVRTRLFASRLLEGRIGFLGTQANVRFLAIELACPRTRDWQQTTLAHELQHAIEIARAKWVIGAATLAQYYQQIGAEIGGDGAAVTFETATARRTAARVRQEMFESAAAGPAHR